MTRPRLLDTSVVSFYIAPDALQKTPKLVERVNEAAAIDGARISFVTLYEIDRGLRKLELQNQGSTKRRYFAMFMSSVTMYGLDTSRDGRWLLTFMRERPCARPRSYSGKLICSSSRPRLPTTCSS